LDASKLVELIVRNFGLCKALFPYMYSNSNIELKEKSQGHPFESNKTKIFK
jgi:hypothetical protein